MESNKRLCELLVQTGAFKDLPEPVILTSGELGIYYVNTEKLCPDSDRLLKEHGDNPAAMINEAVKMMDDSPMFTEAMGILTDKAESLITNRKPAVISGGQRRDWIFSGPVAVRLGLPHVSLFKDGSLKVLSPDKLEEMDVNFGPDLEKVEAPLFGLTAYHVVDLITEGSSIYSVKDGQPRGWVPVLRNAGANISDLVAVVTRNQGGEERLAQQGVKVHPFVSIDEEFLRQYSKNPDRAVQYAKNPKAWSEAYLREHGAMALLSAFDPAKKKDDRAKKFLNRYHDVLYESHKLFAFAEAVEKEFGYNPRSWITYAGENK